MTHRTRGKKRLHPCDTTSFQEKLYSQKARDTKSGGRRSGETERCRRKNRRRRRRRGERKRSEIIVTFNRSHKMKCNLFRIDLSFQRFISFNWKQAAQLKTGQTSARGPAYLHLRRSFQEVRFRFFSHLNPATLGLNCTCTQPGLGYLGTAHLYLKILFSWRYFQNKTISDQ